MCATFSQAAWTRPSRHRAIADDVVTPRGHKLRVKKRDGAIPLLDNCVEHVIGFPVEVRFTAADDIPLSTASGRESAYLAVHVAKGMEYETYFRGVGVMIRAERLDYWDGEEDSADPE